MVTMATTDARERVAAKDKNTSLGTTGRPGGNGARRGPNGNGGGRPLHQDGEPRHYRIGMWMALAAIMMMFAALTSAYVMRSGTRGWQDIALPRMLWLSTALIFASSVTFELARRALRRSAERLYRIWLAVSLLLGFGFLASQLLAWRELVAQGVYLVSNPHSSFFYLLTGLHALHLLGGILGLSYLLWRAVRGGNKQPLAQRRAVTEAVGTYWHFMDGLWVYLFALLFLWR